MAETDTADAATENDAMDADFGAGFAGTETKPTKSPAQTDKSAELPPTSPDAPEIVQVTAKEWNEIKAAAARTASYDSQFSKLFGTTGKIQQILSGLQQTQTQANPPPPRKVEISRAAFAEMEKDFPELAQQTRSALEAALSGLPATGAAEVDATKIEDMLASYTAKREIEALEDAYPEWRQIVGAVDISKEQPDANNPFRKWLGAKDLTYQNQVNGSASAAVIGRAIRLFQNETKTQAKPAPTPRNDARADRIRGAVQPKGDNGGAPSAKTEDDDFLAGFNSR